MIRKIWNSFQAFSRRFGKIQAWIILTCFYFLVLPLFAFLGKRRIPTSGSWTPWKHTDVYQQY